MKALKIKLHQELVNYRKPYSYNFIESYPLPPFSAIKGWIYGSINAEDRGAYYDETIKDLRIAVSGKLDGLTHDLQHMIKLEKMHDIEKIKKNLQTRTPTYVTLISSIDLNIYISAGEKLLSDFQESLFKNYPSLGRYEDLACIEAQEEIELIERSLSPRKNHKLDYYVYICEANARKFEKTRGSYLRIPTTYSINNGIRYFDRTNVLCLTDCSLTEGAFYFDDTEGEDGRLVDFIGVV